MVSSAPGAVPGLTPRAPSALSRGPYASARTKSRVFGTVCKFGSSMASRPVSTFVW